MAVQLSPKALVAIDEEMRIFCVGGATEKDDLLTSLVNSTSEVVLGPDGINGPVLHELVARRFDGNDRDGLQIDPGPIAAVTSVTVDGVVLEAGTYEAEDRTLYRIGDVWPAGRRNIRVEYTAGLAESIATVPEDIRHAVRMQVKHILTAVIEGRSQFAPEDVGAQNPRQYGLIPAVRYLLARYRSPAL
jgi:hypothetical protein